MIPQSRWAPDSIEFGDLGFQHAYAYTKRGDGSIAPTWIPHGMPRFSSGKLTKPIVYLFQEKGKRAHGAKPLGTGFLVSRTSAEVPGLKHIYAITNRHVVQDPKFLASCPRLNAWYDVSKIIEFSPNQWTCDTQDDLAAIDITDHLDLHIHDFAVIEEEHHFVTNSVVDEFFIDIGDDVMMVGLFSPHHGGARNMPTARFGNISMMPDPRALVEQPNGNKRPSYLVDTRSRGGYSGSPVFVYRTPASDLRYSQTKINPQAHHIVDPHRNVLFGLLGIHCSQYPEMVTVRGYRTKNNPVKETDDKIIRDGDKLKLEGGMTVVIPASRITSLLNDEGFEMQRRARDELSRDKFDRLPVPEAIENVETPDEDDDENSNHREDFTSLLNAAAKTKRQAE